MDKCVESYFQEFSQNPIEGNFHKVIVLQDSRDDWKSISKICPKLPRGWFELSHLTQNDRVEFTRDFWFSKLPYQPNMDVFLQDFFELIDDIGVYITQKTSEDALEPQMVYCLKDEQGFYRGYPPASEKDLLILENYFPDVVFPEDYLAFMQIHNGYCKSTDSTGIISSQRVPEAFLKFLTFVEQKGFLVNAEGQPMNPYTLIPFYESFGMPFFQCFWTEWYPVQEMGNVYFSPETNSISDARTRVSSPENMSFPTFTDWLMFYLESVG